MGNPFYVPVDLLRVLLRLGLGLTGAAAINYALWRWLDIHGAISIVFSAPIYAAAAARPVLELIGLWYHYTREFAFRHISGRHFEHHGHMMDVVEDADHHRWIRLADVRKVLHGLPPDRTLRRLCPHAVTSGKSGASSRIQAEALAAFLEKSTDPVSLKFKRWLEKDVNFPARQIRERGQT